MPHLLSLLSGASIISLVHGASLITRPSTNLTLPGSANWTSDSGLQSVTLQQTVYNAVVHTLALYPEALLREIEATSITDATTNPDDLTDVRLIFAIPDRGLDTTLIVEMSHIWGVWLQPRLSPLPVPPNEKTLPAWITVDITTADALMKDARFLGPYWGVIICWPEGLPAARDQPMYMFEMDDNTPGNPKLIFVGTRDGIVTSFNDAEQTQQPGSGTVAATS